MLPYVFVLYIIDSVIVFALIRGIHNAYTECVYALCIGGTYVSCIGVVSISIGESQGLG